MGGLSHHAVSSWPSDITFRTYTKKEVEALSVKELTSPNIFYNESGSESPELGGLHDPAFGPLNRYERCITCGQKEEHCPGHCGHINLAEPAINPLFYKMLKNLITATCMDCCRFLCSEKTIIVLQAKLLCLNKNRMDLYNELENETKENYGVEESESSDMQGTKSKSLEHLREFIKEKLEELDYMDCKIATTRTITLLKRKTIDAFFEIFSKRKRKKCPKCSRQQDEVKFSSGGDTFVSLEVRKKDTHVVDLEGIV